MIITDMEEISGTVSVKKNVAKMHTPPTTPTPTQKKRTRRQNQQRRQHPPPPEISSHSHNPANAPKLRVDSRVLAVPPLVRAREVQDAGNVPPCLDEAGHQRRLCRTGGVPVEAVEREGVHGDAVQQVQGGGRQLALPASVCAAGAIVVGR